MKLIAIMLTCIWIQTTVSFANTDTAVAPQSMPSVHKAPDSGTAEKELTREQKIFYAIGVQLIGNLKRQGIDIDFDLVSQGMRDALAGGPYLVPEAELPNLIVSYQEVASRRMAEQRHADSEQNKREGAAFLQENSKKPGVATLPGGIQYKVLQAGSGSKPTLEDTIEYTYRGTLIDGTPFAQSPADGSSVESKVKYLLPGLRQAVQQMPVGARWQLAIPSDLGYGPRGAGRVVAPNAVLVYEVELISAKPSPAETASTNQGG